MKITLYTIHCPACIVLEKKMKAKSIKFDVVDDVNLLNELGIYQFPMLKVDESIYNYSDAVKFVNAY